MTHKPRRFDLSPDNFIAGVAGQLSAEELGVYWLICLLIYSHCGEIEYDEQRLVKLLPGTHWRNIRAASQRLQQLGKIEVSDGHVMAKGCEAPLQEAITRVSNAVQHGRTGGRPIRESKDLSEADGLNSEKLARDAPSPSPSPPESSHIAASKNFTSIPEHFPGQAERDAATERWTQDGRLDLIAKLDAEVRGFRDHHVSHANTMADWGAAWGKWIKNAMRFNPKPRSGNERKQTSLDVFVRAGDAAVDLICGPEDRSLQSGAILDITPPASGGLLPAGLHAKPSDGDDR